MHKASVNKSALVEKLNGHIFHATSNINWGLIKSDGCIQYKNNSHTFPSNSPNSFAKRNGFICLFDFRNKSEDEIDDAFDECLYDMLRIHGETAFLFLKPDFYTNIIFHKEYTKVIKANQRFFTTKELIEFGGLYVHKTECWSDIKIPTTVISKVFKT